MTANFPAAMEWLDAVGEMIDHQKPLPAHINPGEFEWVRDTVHQCAPYLAAVGLTPLDYALWTTDPVAAIRQARDAMRVLEDVERASAAVIACDIPDAEVGLARIRLKMMVDWLNHVPHAYDFDKQEVTNQIRKAMQSVHAVAWLVGIRPPDIEYERDPIGYMIAHHQFIEAWSAPTDGTRH